MKRQNHSTSPRLSSAISAIKLVSRMTVLLVINVLIAAIIFAVGILLDPKQSLAEPLLPFPQKIPVRALEVSPDPTLLARPWYQCGLRLLEASGKIGNGHLMLPELYWRAVPDDVRSDRLLIVLMAVIHRESAFNPHAASSAAAYGLTQMTQVAVTTAEKECKLPRLRRMDRLYDSFTAVRYGSCYLNFLLKQTEGNINEALILYNGGYLQLAKYRSGDSMVSETSNYVLQVRRSLKQYCAFKGDY